MRYHIARPGDATLWSDRLIEAQPGSIAIFDRTGGALGHAIAVCPRMEVAEHVLALLNGSQPKEDHQLLRRQTRAVTKMVEKVRSAIDDLDEFMDKDDE